MKIFGHERHRNTDPWADAPACAVELGAIGIVIIANQEAIMAALDDLKSAVADLSAQMTANNAAIDGLLGKVTAPGASDADIEAAVTDIRKLIDANKTELAKVAPPAPPAAPAAP